MPRLRMDDSSRAFWHQLCIPLPHKAIHTNIPKVAEEMTWVYTIVATNVEGKDKKKKHS